jgi:hypothetical protein
MPEDAADDHVTHPLSAEPRVVFIHVPKTAGTTLRAIMRSNASHSARLGNVFKGGGGRVVEPDYERMVAKMRDVNVDARFFWGHTPFAVASYMPAEWETNFVTFLRDPVERAISQYYGMVARLEGGDPDDDDASDAGEDDYVGRSARKPGIIRGEFSRDVPYHVALADAAYVSDNLQTRMLSGLPRPFGEVTDEMLDRAIENLRRFRCVGITERFDESLVLLRCRIGYERILFRDQRVNSSRPRGESVPDSLRRAAEQANTFDRELYRHAVAQFERAPEFTDLDSRIDLAALRSARVDGAATLPDMPPELGLDESSWAAMLAERRASLWRIPKRGARSGARRVRNADAALTVRKRDRPAHLSSATPTPKRRRAEGPSGARRAGRVADGNAPVPVKGKQKRSRDSNGELRPKALRANRPRAGRGAGAAEDGIATAPIKRKRNRSQGTDDTPK